MLQCKHKLIAKGFGFFNYFFTSSCHEHYAPRGVIIECSKAVYYLLASSFYAQRYCIRVRNFLPSIHYVAYINVKILSKYFVHIWYFYPYVIGYALLLSKAFLILWLYLVSNCLPFFFQTCLDIHN